jgi:hypothetical protein
LKKRTKKLLLSRSASVREGPAPFDPLRADAQHTFASFTLSTIFAGSFDTAAVGLAGDARVMRCCVTSRADDRSFGAERWHKS